MYLSDVSITTLVVHKHLIEPYDPLRVNPCSYDLGFGDRFVKPTPGGAIDPREPNWGLGEVLDRRDGPVVINPGEFMLATTAEAVKIPNDMAAQVMGKSSLGRLGLFVQNAGHIDPGFEGEITLELFNGGPSPIDLTGLERAAQIAFIKLDAPCAAAYYGKYQGQSGPTQSKGSE